MTLATAGPDGRPSARIVLLRGYDGRGFVFFTNYECRKGRELEAIPTQPWSSTGTISSGKSGSKGQSKERRPKNPTRISRPGRSARESVPGLTPVAVIADRKTLEDRVRVLEPEYPDGQVRRPDYWGGYRVIPSVIEFWQGRPSGLHDRLRDTRTHIAGSSNDCRHDCLTHAGVSWTSRSRRRSPWWLTTVIRVVQTTSFVPSPPR